MNDFRPVPHRRWIVRTVVGLIIFAAVVAIAWVVILTLGGMRLWGRIG